jgi:Tol biopolymer transport system component
MQASTRSRLRRLGIATVGLAAVTGVLATARPANALTGAHTELVSRASGIGGAQFPNGGNTASVSVDGRFVAFLSRQSNGILGVFVRDRQTASTTLVSFGITQFGTPLPFPANGDSSSPVISADGRFVAFVSTANNLIRNDTNGKSDVFVRDLFTSTTTRVSLTSANGQADGNSFEPSISADGRFVAFSSDATNLILGDRNGQRDVFVRDRVGLTTERVSVGTIVKGGIPITIEADSLSAHPSISANGGSVAFESLARNLVPGDTNNAEDVFVRDRQAGSTERISVGGGGTQGDRASSFPSISADGQAVAFQSDAANLVTGDTNSVSDVFVRDRVAGTTDLVSVAAGGVQVTDESRAPAISGDGRWVAFQAGPVQLVPLVADPIDVFVRDRVGGTTTLVSVAANGGAANGDSVRPAVTFNGNAVAFDSAASNLVIGDANVRGDVFIRIGQP